MKPWLMLVMLSHYIMLVNVDYTPLMLVNIVVEHQFLSIQPLENLKNGNQWEFPKSALRNHHVKINVHHVPSFFSWTGQHEGFFPGFSL